MEFKNNIYQYITLDSLIGVLKISSIFIYTFQKTGTISLDSQTYDSYTFSTPELQLVATSAGVLVEAPFVSITMTRIKLTKFVVNSIGGPFYLDVKTIYIQKSEFDNIGPPGDSESLNVNEGGAI